MARNHVLSCLSLTMLLVAGDPFTASAARLQASEASRQITLDIADFAGKGADSDRGSTNPRGMQLSEKDWRTLQQTPMWCWAACIQMIVSYACGEPVVSQQEIVIRNYGLPVVAGARSLEQIRANLDLWVPRLSGNDMRLTGIAHPGPLDGDGLYEELSAKRPVVLGVNGQSHVVICYGAKFREAGLGGKEIEAVHIFDPYPGSGGDQWLTAKRLPQHSRYRWENTVTFVAEPTDYVSHQERVYRIVEPSNLQILPTYAGRSISFEWKLAGDLVPEQMIIRTFALDRLLRPLDSVDVTYVFDPEASPGDSGSTLLSLPYPVPYETWTIIAAVKLPHAEVEQENDANWSSSPESVPFGSGRLEFEDKLVQVSIKMRTDKEDAFGWAYGTLEEAKEEASQAAIDNEFDETSLLGRLDDYWRGSETMKARCKIDDVEFETEQAMGIVDDDTPAEAVGKRYADRLSVPGAELHMLVAHSASETLGGIEVDDWRYVRDRDEEADDGSYDVYVTGATIRCWATLRTYRVKQ